MPQAEEESLSNHNSIIRQFDYSIIDSISAQIEFCPNGDFITRSNEVECVYRRINPDDWDDDGIANDEDAEPMVAADETQFGPHQTLPDGANSNAYCWVDFVVPRTNTKVTFAGDGASNLADPTFIAKAGETNRVTLLIGKLYRATCAFPFKVVAKSSDEIVETWNGVNEVELCWPVQIFSHDSSAKSSVLAVNLMAVQNAAASSSTSFSMFVCPANLGGVFVWENACCSVVERDDVFSYSCRGLCGCSGCSADGYYVYEGFKVACWGGGACGCSSSGDYDPNEPVPDDGPYAADISVAFSKDAVVFEDRHESVPGVWVEKQSTETILYGFVRGGPNGGTATFEFAGRDKLDGGMMRSSVVVPAGERYDFKIKYMGKLPSDSSEDIVVRGTFKENDVNDESLTSEAKLTSVRVNVTALETTRTATSEHRRTFGVREILSCKHLPSDAEFSLEMSSPDAVVDLTEERVYCPWTGGLDPTMQVFALKGDGTSSVSKYGHVIERRTDNKVYLDGVLQN